MLEKVRTVLYDAYVVISENLLNIILGVLVLVVFFLLRKKLSKYIGKIFEKLFSKKPVIGAGIRSSIKDPLSAFFICLGLYIAFAIMAPPPGVMVWVVKIFRLSIIVAITWAMANFTPFLTSLVLNFEDKTSRRTNAAALKFIANVFKVIIIAISVVIVISELGYNISGLITGLGLGGLTFSLAAQSTAANLFGGFEIILDKPFDVGDRITTPSVDGVVEDITMRSTRIRTVADTVVIIPNSQLINEPITNCSKMSKRYVEINLGFKYGTSSDVLQKCAQDIEDMLRSHDNVFKDRIVVTFKEFSSSSLDLNVVFFTDKIYIDDYLRLRDSVNYKIKEIADRNGAEFAFPSTSVYIESTNTANSN